MAAMNLPLITWCIIVAAMTALITVMLFNKRYNPVNPHGQTDRMIEIGKENEELFMQSDIVSTRDEI